MKNTLFPSSWITNFFRYAICGAVLLAALPCFGGGRPTTNEETAKVFAFLNEVRFAMVNEASDLQFEWHDISCREIARTERVWSSNFESIDTYCGFLTQTGGEISLEGGTARWLASVLAKLGAEKKRTSAYPYNRRGISRLQCRSRFVGMIKKQFRSVPEFEQHCEIEF